MKNPNGYGGISKLSGKRRKPYLVRKTTGWYDKKKRKVEIIGYYATRREAMEALAEYNKNPFQIESSKLTFEQIYNNWNELKFKNVGRSSIVAYRAAFKTCKPLHESRFVDIKTVHLQSLIDNCGKNYSSLRKIKVLFHQLFDYAMKNDIVSKDYSQYVEIGRNTAKNNRKIFSDTEIKKLWKYKNEFEFIDSILIMIYTGLRIGELLLVEKEHVDLDEQTIIGGLKTQAGKNRIIPIHKKIEDIIIKRLKSSNRYLIENAFGEQMKYSNYYREKFIPIMEQLNMEHKPHDCRHTFATLLNNAEANGTSIKKLVGHSSFITTEKIYTHKDVKELRKAVELIN